MTEPYTITITNSEGEHDITEAVQILYDSLHASLDFGSGFLDMHEVAQMRRIATLAGWGPLEYSGDECAGCGHKHWAHSNHSPRGCRKCDCAAFALKESG